MGTGQRRVLEPRNRTSVEGRQVRFVLMRNAEAAAIAAAFFVLFDRRRRGQNVTLITGRVELVPCLVPGRVVQSAS